MDNNCCKEVQQGNMRRWKHFLPKVIVFCLVLALMPMSIIGAYGVTVSIEVGVPGTDEVVSGSDIVSQCLEKGLLLNCTHGNVIRFMPPMTVTKEEIDEGLAIFEFVLRHYNAA